MEISETLQYQTRYDTKKTKIIEKTRDKEYGWQIRGIYEVKTLQTTMFVQLQIIQLHNVELAI